MDSPDPADRRRADEPRRPRAGGRPRWDEASKRLGTAGRKVSQASKASAAGVASASRKTAGFTGRAGRATGRRIRGLTSAQGAGESGLSRLIELGAINAAGDTALAVSLAGTVFFAVPTEQARDRVALFLLLTMAPFALMAPLIGPILDRFRHGRRWAIGATLGVRGFLVWSLAASIHSEAWLYPAALGCLVASKAYGVTRASAVPRLLPREISLVTANSRISLAGVAGATVGAGIAGGFAAIGPQWSLRWAALVYTIGLILAIRLPSKVDSPAGEEMVGTGSREARRRAITAAVARGIRCNLGLRFVSGFLTMYLAFLLRDRPISGIDGALAAGAVIAAAGLGNSLGTLTGSLLKARKPEIVVLVVLLVDATVAVVVAVLYGFPVLIVLGLVAGLCSSLGKLSLDAMIQRDVPETVRTSVFARSETVLQLAWVLGGGCGIIMPLIPRVGFGFLAAVLVALVILVLRYKPAPRSGDHAVGPHGPRTPSPDGPSRRAPRSADGPPTAGPSVRTAAGPHDPTVQFPQDSEPSATPSAQPPGGDGSAASGDRTVRITERRAAGRRTDDASQTTEPTVEIHLDRADRSTADGAASAPPQTVGRWWSGELDDDDTTAEQAPWADDTTVEHRPDRTPPARPHHDNAHGDDADTRARADDETRVEPRKGLFGRRR